MRLVTRADFDGLVCGSLITLAEDVETYLFVEPKFMQDGQVEIRTGDIIANLPYHPDCSLWFDHHITNEAHGFDKPIVPGRGGYRLAPSAARVVYEYYELVASSESRVPSPRPDSPKSKTHNSKIEVGLRILNSDRMKFLLAETDKIDAGLHSIQDVLQPDGYVLISMTIDGKNTEDEPYWLKLIRLLRDAPLDEVLGDREVQQQCERILDRQGELGKVLQEHACQKGNVIYLDLRGTKDVTEWNRFLLYTLFPKGNISLKLTDDTQRVNATAISVGYNIFNTTSKVNVGALMQKYGGGGHKVVGSCRVPKAEADKAAEEILAAIKE